MTMNCPFLIVSVPYQYTTMATYSVVVRRPNRPAGYLGNRGLSDWEAVI